MKRNRVVVAAAGAALLLLFGYLLWPPAGPAVSPLEVRFLGYGIDGAGDRKAEFMLTNRGELSLLRESHCRIEYADDPHLVPAFNVSAPKSLSTGEAEKVTVPAPPNRGRWRAGFKVLEKDRRFAGADWASKHSLIPQSIRTRDYNNMIDISWSEWIAD